MAGVAPAGPRPLGVRLDRYLFDVPGAGEQGFTFFELANRDVLRRICGGDDRWLRESFPSDHVMVVLCTGAPERMPVGLNVLAAARWCAGLCIDAQNRRDSAANVARPQPGPVDHLIAWLRSWRPGRAARS